MLVIFNTKFSGLLPFQCCNMAAKVHVSKKPRARGCCSSLFSSLRPFVARQSRHASGVASRASCDLTARRVSWSDRAAFFRQQEKSCVLFVRNFGRLQVARHFENAIAVAARRMPLLKCRLQSLLQKRASSIHAATFVADFRCLFLPRIELRKWSRAFFAPRSSTGGSQTIGDRVAAFRSPFAILERVHFEREHSSAFDAASKASSARAWHTPLKSGRSRRTRRARSTVSVGALVGVGRVTKVRARARSLATVSVVVALPSA